MAHEVDTDTFEVLWRTETRNRATLANLGPERRVGALILDRFAFGITGAHGVRANSELAHVNRDAARQGRHGTFGCIVMLHTDRAGNGRKAGAEQNGTTRITGFRARAHVTGSLAREVECPMLVNGKKAVPSFTGHVGEAALVHHQTGICNGAIDPAHRLDGGSEGLDHLRLVRYVDLL